MATVVSAYTPFMYHQQAYYYPTLPSVYPTQTYGNNFTYYVSQPSQPVQQSQPAQQPQPTYHQVQVKKQEPVKTTEYVDSSIQSLRPRRQPRVFREVIMLPTPEPVYRQIRHRLPTPERQVIHRTVFQKNNGDVVVREHQPKPKTRTQSRAEHRTQPRVVRSRQVHTD